MPVTSSNWLDMAGLAPAYDNWSGSHIGWRLAGAGVVALLIAGTVLLVWHTGGTKLVYAHFIYVPILIAAGLFGLPGGILAAVAGGLALGPMMPLDVEAGIPQDTLNWVTRTAMLTFSGSLAGAICAVLGRQTAEARLQGYRSPWTRLPNRAQMMVDLDRLIVEGEQSLIVLKIALSHHASTVTSLGHDFADDLHRAAAARLGTALGGDFRLYDLSEGAFGTILPAANYRDAVKLTNTLLAHLDEPFSLQAVPVLAGGHIGVARWPQHGADAPALMRAAAAALHDGGLDVQRRAVYDQRADTERRAMTALLPDLQSALRTGAGLQLHFQPKICLDTRDCVGVEALIRWQHPRRGAVSPGLFIPLAERTALIGPLSEWVALRAVDQLSAWRTAGIDVPIAINLSMRNLDDDRLALALADMLRTRGVHSCRVEVEITETALMAAPERARQSLESLRGEGISVALDDFGTGQCSLAYLRDLPVDSLKLDRSFLRDIEHDDRSQILIGATIDAAHRLGFKVVAEGIEDAGALERLHGMGCDHGQGYHIARPMPDADLRQWLANQPAAGTA
ncbi:MAG: EAL domain-containing protein [Acetobacterales bacterium]